MRTMGGVPDRGAPSCITRQGRGHCPLLMGRCRESRSGENVMCEERGSFGLAEPPEREKVNDKLTKCGIIYAAIRCDPAVAAWSLR